MTKTMSLMRIAMSVGMIGFIVALGLGATGAFFNDTETSTGNVFTAGSLDLKVDSVGHVNGLVCYEGQWVSEAAVQWNENTEQLEVVGEIDTENAAYNEEFPANVPQAGDDCASTWAETDLGPETFFSFADLKPGDNGENTISLHVYDNDAYACAIIDDMQDNDNGITEPEFEDGDTTGGIGGGELSQELRFFAWADDGDNIWEPQGDERPLFSNIEGPASDVIDGVVYPLFTPQTGVLKATTTQYIGLYWCYGAISTEGDVLSCDGSEVTNVTQTDSLEASFTFYVEQARNNQGFTCPVLDGGARTVQVSSNDLFTENDRLGAFLSGDWFFYNDTADTIMAIDEFSPEGSNDIVTGPDATDAAGMILHDGGARYNIATYQFSATPLASISTLKYRIYDASASAQTPFLNFNIDFDNSDTWQRRLVQVPDGVAEDVWTEVDALADTWTISGGNWPIGTTEDGSTPGSTPKTWAEILSEYPTAALRTTDSFFGVRVGHPGPAGEESYVDWIEFDGVIYDFQN